MEWRDGQSSALRRRGQTRGPVCSHWACLVAGEEWASRRTWEWTGSRQRASDSIEWDGIGLDWMGWDWIGLDCGMGQRQSRGGCKNGVTEGSEVGEVGEANGVGSSQVLSGMEWSGVEQWQLAVGRLLTLNMVERDDQGKALVKTNT